MTRFVTSAPQIAALQNVHSIIRAVRVGKDWQAVDFF
jgi:hypothetical protein